VGKGKIKMFTGRRCRGGSKLISKLISRRGEGRQRSGTDELGWGIQTKRFKEGYSRTMMGGFLGRKKNSSLAKTGLFCTHN